MELFALAYEVYHEGFATRFLSHALRRLIAGTGRPESILRSYIMLS